MTTFDTFNSQTQPAPPRAWDRRTLSNGAGHFAEKTPIRVIEGGRGISVRATVYLRNALYMLTVLACTGAVQGLLRSMPTVANGGMWMLFSATLCLVTAALGCAFFVNHRNEIIVQCRHFLFGIMLFPGTGIAVLMWATRGATATSSSSVLSSAFTNALPLLFFATVIIPSLIFIKVIAGMRNLHRSTMDDQAAVALWTRQDNLVR